MANPMAASSFADSGSTLPFVIDGSGPLHTEILTDTLRPISTTCVSRGGPPSDPCVSRVGQASGTDELHLHPQYDARCLREVLCHAPHLVATRGLEGIGRGARHY